MLEKILKNKRVEAIILFFLVGLFFTIFTTISLHRYWQFSVWYYDFGIFHQAISSVSRLEAPIIDHLVFSGKNILGDHFHPLIFVVSPFYAIFPRGETLLIVQSLFVALSGVVMYLVAKHLTKNKLESLLLLVIYLSFVGLHNALITEFHALTLLPLPLSLFFLGMVKKDWRLYLLGLLTVLLTKETTFVIPAWFGLWLAVKNRGRWRKIGLGTMVGSLVYGFVVIKYVMPWFSGQEYYYLAEATKSSSLGEIFTLFKMKTVFKTLLSFGFLPVLAPETWPPILFNWWSRFESAGSTRHNLGLHYNAEIAPTLMLGAIIGWVRFKKLAKKYFKVKNNFLVWILLGVSAFCLVLSLAIFKSPAILFTNKAFYAHTKNFAFLDQLMAKIPGEGSVMAQHNLAGKLAHRQVYFLRNNYQDFEPDYIVIDTRAGQEPNNFLGVDNFEALVASVSADPNYEIFYDQGEQLIFQKVR